MSVSAVLPAREPIGRTGGGRESTVDAEFHNTVELYHVLASRQAQNKLFLQRCWRHPSRQHEHRDVLSRAPVVRYECGHDSMNWHRDMPELQCLWCSKLGAVRFANARDLMEHLRCSHGRFSFLLNHASPSVDDELIVVEMKLNTGIAELLATRSEKFKAWAAESVYANILRYPRYGVPMPDQPDAPGLWRTTRILLRPASGDGTPNSESVERGQKRPRCETSVAIAPFTSWAVENPDQRRETAARVLQEYNRQRFKELVRRNKPLTNDCLNEFVSVIMPEQAGFGASHGSGAVGLTNPSRTRQALRVRKDVRDSEPNPTNDEPSPEGNQPEHIEPRAQVGSVGSSTRKNSAASPNVKEKKRGQRKNSRQPPQRKSGGRKGGSKQPRGAPSDRADAAFSSFADGVERGIIYRSVVQSQPTVQALGEGEDSDDGDDLVDEIWRLEIGAKQLSEFLDTSAREKILMNLWNEFVIRDVEVYSDRHVEGVAIQFARKHGMFLANFHLEVLFVRLVTLLSRRALLDAKGVYQVMCALKDAKTDKNRQENLRKTMAEYPFFRRIVQVARIQDEERAQNDQAGLVEMGAAIGGLQVSDGESAVPCPPADLPRVHRGRS